MGFDFTVIAPLLPCHCGFSFVFGCGVSFLVSSSVFLSMIVQQLVVIPVLSQKGVNTRPFTLPSWTNLLTLALLKPTITSYFLWTFLFLISLTNLNQSGKRALLLVYFSFVCFLVFLFHKLSLDTMTYTCETDSPMWWESYLVWIELVLFTSQLKQVDSSSCSTLQDEKTPWAKLFFANLFLLFIADGSSFCSEIPLINLNTQYKILIYW